MRDDRETPHSAAQLRTSVPRLRRSEGRRLRAWEGQSTGGMWPWQTCWGLKGEPRGETRALNRVARAYPFPPDRAGGPTGCLDTCGNPQNYQDSCVSDEPQRFSTSLLEEALTPENRSRTVRPALRLARGWKHGRRETRAPATHAPSNRSRKRFRFPAPLGSGPFRGPFFCALGGAASAAAGSGPIVGS